MQLQAIKLVGACCLLAALGVGGAVMAVRRAPAPRDEPRGTAGDETSTEKPIVLVVLASRPLEYNTVRLALEQALPAATKAGDPYLVTFALIGLAKAQNTASDRDSALKTIAEADRVAGTVANEHLRRLAVMRTAVARGQLGDSVPARATLERFASEGAGLGAEARYNLMSMVIDFQYQAGFKDDARATLDKELAAVDAIADEGLRDGGFFRLLGTQLTLGDYECALRTAARYTGGRSNYRATLLQEIMRYHGAAHAGPPKEVTRRALELSREIIYPYPRAQAQCEIASALARAGDIAAGLELAREIGKDVDEPFQVICSSELPRALVEIAREQAKADALAAAIESLREARSAALERRRRTPSTLIESGRSPLPRLNSATSPGQRSQRPRSRPTPVEKALALAALARGQAKAGDRQAANATLREAHARAQAIRAPRAELDGPQSGGEWLPRSSRDRARRGRDRRREGRRCDGRRPRQQRLEVADPCRHRADTGQERRRRRRARHRRVSPRRHARRPCIPLDRCAPGSNEAMSRSRSPGPPGSRLPRPGPSRSSASPKGSSHASWRPPRKEHPGDDGAA